MSIRAPTRKPVKVAAVHANVGTEAWYRQQLDAHINAAHLDLLMQLASVNGNLPVKLAGDASAVSGLTSTLKSWAFRWTKRLDRMSSTISKQFANKNFSASQQSMMAAFKESGFTIAFKPTEKSIEAYRAVVAENVNLIKSISQQYLTDVQSDVWTSVMRGGDLDTLSRQLHKTYGITQNRAALIARDQNNKAMAIIENTRRQELGITEAIWQHSSAGKVSRPTHVAMNGQRFRLAEGMYDSKEGRKVLPGELINCRCSSSSIIPGLDS